MKIIRGCVHGLGLESSPHNLYNTGGWIKNNLTEKKRRKKKKNVIFNLGQFPSLGHWAAAYRSAEIQEHCGADTRAKGGKGEAERDKTGTAAKWSCSSGSDP